MGKIAASDGPGALNLFRNVLTASASIPGVFSPMLIDVDVDGRHSAEMHVDGGGEPIPSSTRSNALRACRRR
jgi:predicted acylesterase/phospholipase RssA